MNQSEPRDWKYNGCCSIRAVEEWETILKRCVDMPSMPVRLVPFLPYAYDVMAPVCLLSHTEELDTGSPDFLPWFGSINGGSRMLLANIGLEE